MTQELQMRVMIATKQVEAELLKQTGVDASLNKNDMKEYWIWFWKNTKRNEKTSIAYFASHLN